MQRKTPLRSKTPMKRTGFKRKTSSMKRSSSLKTRSPQTLPKLKKTVQDLANKYARLRDCAGEPGTTCISCGVWHLYEKLDGGHFIPTTTSSTRFDERNINAQCHRCNRFLHGNIRGYFRGMEAKYGRSIVDDLEAIASQPLKKWTRDELEQLKTYYKEKINGLT